VQNYQLKTNNGWIPAVTVGTPVSIGYFYAYTDDPTLIQIQANTPATGQTFDKWTGTAADTITVDNVNNAIAYITMPAHAVELTATYKAQSFVITQTVGTGGTSSVAAANTTVSYGGSQTFTFTPNSGYVIDKILIDGVNNTAAVSAGSYTFSNVNANHTIEVQFKLNSFVWTASAGTGGTVSPTSATISSTGSQVFTATPSSGYQVATWTKTSGTATVSQSGNTYTVSNPSSAGAINVTFSLINHVITASAGSGGTITPSGSVNVAHGGNQTFNFTPSAGYEVASITVDGTTLSPASSYTFSNVTANHTISVTFALINYTWSASVSGSNGTVTPTGNQTIASNGSKQWTATPASGYTAV
jgi:hypothetical protein